MAKVKTICKNGHDLSKTRKQGPTGTPYCWICKSAYSKEYLNNRPIMRANNDWRNKLKRIYNITEQDYIDMYIKQNGNCSICYKYIEYRGFSTHIDHCHDSTNVRSLLCSNCNTALGLLKENIEVMYRAIDYIEKHREINYKEQ